MRYISRQRCHFISFPSFLQTSSLGRNYWMESTATHSNTNRICEGVFLFHFAKHHHSSSPRPALIRLPAGNTHLCFYYLPIHPSILSMVLQTSTTRCPDKVLHIAIQGTFRSASLQTSLLPSDAFVDPFRSESSIQLTWDPSNTSSRYCSVYKSYGKIHKTPHTTAQWQSRISFVALRMEDAGLPRILRSICVLRFFFD